MKLIDEKKFLEGIYDIAKLESPITIRDIEELLSKHLKDLPKKQNIDKPDSVEFHPNRGFVWNEDRRVGYNQCLEDCEGK